MAKKKSNIVKLSIEKDILDDNKKTVQEFKTLAEKIAKSTVFVKNHYVNELREKYAHYDRMKRVDKFFPYAQLEENAKRIPLYVDEPMNSQESEICYQKAKVMQKLNLKYVILEKDTELFDALTQLGVIK